MKFKKLLGIISVVIVVVFSMMLTTSYAWYAFDNASTVFEGMTNNDDIIVSYQKGEYINATTAIPITSDQVDMYSEKNNFNIVVKNNAKDNEMLVSISLVSIEIDDSLLKDSFKIELYHQSSKVSSDDLTGRYLTSATKKLADVILDNDVTNNFELRLYILDDGTDQSTMENLTFKAKIKVDVISRLKNSLNDYNNSDIYISSVTIDGESSNYIPTDGYYSMVATCSKGSNLTWDALSKTITYNSGSYVNDNCSLAFTSSIDYPLLSEMPVGSYVKYTGTNGCDGIHCEGYNANYVSDTDKGYCVSSPHGFSVNGWRIGYVEDGSAHLISAGAPECMCSNSDGTASSNCSEVLSDDDFYKHIDNLDNMALKYCNKNYVKGGVCDNTTVWAMDDLDFKKIMGIEFESCVSSQSTTCGYTNDLIDIGGFYWLASYNSSSSTNGVSWAPNHRYINIITSATTSALGLRPVISLSSSVFVTGGKGTMDDPFVISKVES